MTTKTIRKYAQNINAQINPNLASQNNWKDLKNSINNTKLVGYSYYSKKTTSSKDSNGKKVTNTVYKHPYTLTADRFGFELPSCAYIKKITFGVRMSSNEYKKAYFPSCGFYIRGKSADVKSTKKNQTGWHNGWYFVYSDRKISTNMLTERYVMDRTNFKKGNHKISHINSEYFGVDINFNDELDDVEVALQCVWCEIEFEVPNYSLEHTGTVTSESNPRILSTGVVNSISFRLKQPSNASDGVRTFKIILPYGCEYASTPTVTRGTISATSDPQIYEWSLNCYHGTDETLTIRFIDYTVNLQNINVTGQVFNNYFENSSPIQWTKKKNDKFHFQTNRGLVDDYNDMVIQLGLPDHDLAIPHQNHTNCFTVTSLSSSNDGIMNMGIKNNKAFYLIDDIVLDPSICDTGVSITGTNLDDFTDYTFEFKEGHYQSLYYIPANSYIELDLSVPSNNVQFNLGFHFCIKPTEEGSNTLTIVSDITTGSNSESLTYNVLPPYEYHIGSTVNDVEDTVNGIYEKHGRMVTEQINFTNHRIATEIETGAYVLPCTVRDGDSLMYELAPNIHMYLWEQIDYIGCVPIEHHHFEPKSVYKDKLLDSHYKNKRYMGKELASDETIDLNIRLHPHQVTTIQGLIDMDKPVPINANHKCFEGDALNHRGYVELYGITTTETNPNWYKCEIDVKYLTHNLNTRFHIRKGSRTFSNYTIPSLLADINNSGDSISENTESDFFIIDTDGTYAYIEDDEEYVDYVDGDGNTIAWIGESTEYTTTIDDESVTLVGHDIIEYLEGLNYECKSPEITDPVSNIQILETYNVDSSQKNQFSIDAGQHILVRSREKLASINHISCEWSSSALSELKENAINRIIRLVDNEGNSVFEYEYSDFELHPVSQTNLETDIETNYVSCRVIGRLRNMGDYTEVINREIHLPYDLEDDNLSY